MNSIQVNHLMATEKGVFYKGIEMKGNLSAGLSEDLAKGEDLRKIFTKFAIIYNNIKLMKDRNDKFTGEGNYIPYTDEQIVSILCA